MKTKLLIGLIICLLSFSFMGCLEDTPQSSGQQQLSKEDNLNLLYQKVPTPKVVTAQERKLVAKRVQIFDKDNKLGYVYVFISGVSTPLGYYTVFGKVASLNSFLVPQQRITDEAVVKYYDGSTNVRHVGGWYVLDDADLDGTYGNNIEGVFFFTDSNTYVELPTNGCLSYLYSDQPLPIKVPKLNIGSIQ